MNPPLIPDTAPFTAEQRAWLNGFLAGVLGGMQQAETTPSAPEQAPLLIAFGSQSGNAESLAKKLAKRAAARGFSARALGMDRIKAEQLANEKHLMLITSTWGEGDMPDNALSFWESLNQNGSSPHLGGVKYSVLALGDKNYGDTFCLAGKQMDARLAELGAERVSPRVDCDVDFDDLAEQWSAATFTEFLGSASNVSTSSEEELPDASLYNKGNPFPAALLENRKLNAEGSSKNTRHLALSLAGSDLSYEAGDALGVYVENCPDVVKRIISTLGFDREFEVKLPDGNVAPLHEALKKHYAVRDWLGKIPESGFTLEDFIGGLRKLQPRLYSIASSQKAHPEEVHLTVSVVRYEMDGMQHGGVASTFLTERLAQGETAGVFLHTANHFRLPEDPATPIIMVGPGTGIAPFRAFLEERASIQASGKNWLFFGDQHEAYDFLYRDEICEWFKSGHLTRLDTAFSRDQAEKVYVQNHMIRAGVELWNWLEAGAYFYVCGDAKLMAKDVDKALHQVIESHGNKSPEEAAVYVNDLKKAKRYARDVY